MRLTDLMAGWLFGLLPLSALATGPAIPAPCQASQLSLKLLARETPGMMKERWLIGVINQGSQSCRLLAQAPHLSGEDAEGEVPLGAERQNQPGWLTLSANHQRDLIAARRIIWFGVDLSHAEPADFNRLKVSLMGLTDHPFTLALAGNSLEIRRISALTPDIRRWLGNSQCQPGSGWQGNDWTVNLQQTVQCE